MRRFITAALAALLLSACADEGDTRLVVVPDAASDVLEDVDGGDDATDALDVAELPETTPDAAEDVDAEPDVPVVYNEPPAAVVETCRERGESRLGDTPVCWAPGFDIKFSSSQWGYYSFTCTNEGEIEDWTPCPDSAQICTIDYGDDMFGCIEGSVVPDCEPDQPRRQCAGTAPFGVDMRASCTAGRHEGFVSMCPSETPVCQQSSSGAECVMR